jgi:FlaA1/EpsC-like NDP-sugar epimerase
MKNLLIIGAGSAGKMVANEILNHKDTSKIFQIIGFLDDNKNIKNIGDLPVLGPISNAKAIITKYNIDEVIIAIPSAGREVINKIVNSLYKANVNIKIVPGIFEIIEGKVNLNQIRDIDAKDLLGREEIGFDVKKILPYYKNKTILITGAGGSIGSEILRQLLKLNIKKVIAFGHGENSIHSLVSSLNYDKKIEYIIGDIKDQEKLDHELKKHKIDIFFHAAAHKHVPLMEAYPDEAVKNNIIGTYNCALSAIKNKVKKFILISTDKAVNPTSVMGQTKRIAEKIVLSLNNLQDTTKFSLTRFGNVLSSRGSVVPVFKRQIQAGGPVTVTHRNVTRYFMSIPEAARLVIKAATIDNGNIFILDMGKPIKIVDLAKTMIRLYGYDENQIKIKYIGLQKGEKMHEDLHTRKEILKKTEFDKLLVSNEKDGLLSEAELNDMIEIFRQSNKNFDRKKIISLLIKYSKK